MSDVRLPRAFAAAAALFVLATGAIHLYLAPTDFEEAPYLGTLFFLTPGVTALLAWLFLDERIYPFHIAGIALILAGIALTTRGHRGVPEAGPE